MSLMSWMISGKKFNLMIHSFHKAFAIEKLPMSSADYINRTSNDTCD